MANKKAPEPLTLSQAFVAPMPDFNSALRTNIPDPDTASRVLPYNQDVDNGLASRRSKHDCRTHAELAAATSGDLPLGDGLSLRSAMAGQMENDQYPMRTNAFGKQRS